MRYSDEFREDRDLVAARFGCAICGLDEIYRKESN